MTNIPTELLRTLIAVVDQRSFTKAAHLLGITQPAVSTHVKRLQFLLGGDLFDKSAPGVALTPKGELIVNYARRMLTINDQMLDLAVSRPVRPPLRIGMPGDFAGVAVPLAIASFRANAPSLRFQVRSDGSDNLLRDLRRGLLDLAVVLTTSGPALDAQHYWAEEVVWVRSPKLTDIKDPIPLASYGEGFLLHNLSTSVLSQLEREYELVFSAFSMTGLLTAVAEGLGVSLIPRRNFRPDLVVWENGPMAQSLNMYCGIYLRDGSDRELLEGLGDAIANALQPGAQTLVPLSSAPVEMEAPADTVEPWLQAGRRS